MKYNTLGKTGIKISEIGFGCMSLGKNPEAESIRLIEKAIDAGINYFDTADLYDKGSNEKLVGKALKPFRSKIIMATKVGNEWRNDGSGWDWNPRRKYILTAIDKSLQRLQTDYIDLYQLHGGTIDDPMDEVVETFELLKQQGKILHYGISSIRPNVIKKYVNHSNISSVMLQYSLLDRRPEEEMLQFLYENKISVLARGVLAQGLLVNKPAKEYLGLSIETVNRVQQQLESVLERNTAIALEYVLHHWAVSSAVIGFRSMEQLNETIEKNYFLDEKIYKELKEKTPVKMYDAHRE